MGLISYLQKEREIDALNKRNEIENAKVRELH